MSILEIIFICCLSVVFYTYIGYGVVLYVLVKIKSIINKNVNLEIDVYEPKVTMFVAAYNEMSCIQEKVENMFELNYPSNKIQFLFVTDGSDDGTPEFLSKYDNIQVIHSKSRGGKIGAINQGMEYVENPIVIYSDANALLNPDAVKEIVKHYLDPKVGCVAGEKRVFSSGTDGASGAGEGIYWKYESWLKSYDYELYSAVGAAGELFSIRTRLHQNVESDTILDDFIISLRIAMSGYKIAYEPKAYASEFASSSIIDEQKRKVRISAGGIQSVFRLAELFNPFKHGWLTFQFISHRVLRWTLTPVLLFLLLPLNVVLVLDELSQIYTLLLVAQLGFYAISAVGYLLSKVDIKLKAFFIPFYFIFMNTCVFLGMFRFVKGEQTVLWEKARS